MLYNHEAALRATEERIKRCIPKPNQSLILDYESHCFAQGLKIAGILKQLIELKIIAEMLSKDFREANTLALSFYRLLKQHKLPSERTFR